MKRAFRSELWTLVAFGLLTAACGSPTQSADAPTSTSDGPRAIDAAVDSAPRQPDFSKLNAACFVAASANPVIRNGDFFAGSNWNDPHVLKVGSQFVMYASADTNFEQNIKVYRLVSSDAKTWTLAPSTPVFERSAEPTAWDRGSTETPAVAFFKGTYYMFYTGYSSQTDGATYNVGYATSPDGIAWTRQPLHLAPTNPFGAPDLNFMQFRVGEPAPVVVNNTLHVYFAANGAHLSVNADLFTVGVIRSSDGQNWDAPQMAFAPDQAIYPSAMWAGYSTPHAVVLDNKVNMFFDVAQRPFKQTKFHRAVSADGIGNWTQDSQSLLDKTALPWADDQINGPSVLLDGTKLYMWFGGQGNLGAFPDISMGIGLMTCDL
jgi:sucrose-6-phosphate hydrolase SacC (GH32 family)